MRLQLRSVSKLLTIWARQTLHSALLLSPAEVLVLKVLLLHLLVLKWHLFTNLLSLYGRRVCRTVPACLYWHDLSKCVKMSAPLEMLAAADILTLFLRIFADL